MIRDPTLCPVCVGRLQHPIFSIISFEKRAPPFLFFLFSLSLFVTASFFSVSRLHSGGGLILFQATGYTAHMPTSYCPRTKKTKTDTTSICQAGTAPEPN